MIFDRTSLVSNRVRLARWEIDRTASRPRLQHTQCLRCFFDFYWSTVVTMNRFLVWLDWMLECMRIPDAEPTKSLWLIFQCQVRHEIRKHQTAPFHAMFRAVVFFRIGIFFWNVELNFAHFVQFSELFITTHYPHFRCSIIPSRKMSQAPTSQTPAHRMFIVTVRRNRRKICIRADPVYCNDVSNLSGFPFEKDFQNKVAQRNRELIEIAIENRYQALCNQKLNEVRCHLSRKWRFVKFARE